MQQSHLPLCEMFVHTINSCHCAEFATSDMRTLSRVCVLAYRSRHMHGFIAQKKSQTHDTQQAHNITGV